MFEVLTAVTVLFWGVVPCSLVEICQHLGSTMLPPSPEGSNYHMENLKFHIWYHFSFVTNL